MNEIRPVLQELWLVRHGPAASRDAERWPNDALRPLTRSGKAVVHGLCDRLSLDDVCFDRLLSSPFLRCVETGQILKPLVSSESRRRVKRVDALAHGGDPNLAWREIAAFEGIVAAVGHSPELEMILGVMLGISSECFSLAKGEALHLVNRAGQMVIVESYRPGKLGISRYSAKEI